MAPAARPTPTPTTDDATTCVVDTGAPTYDEARITTVEAVWLENPSIGCRWKMRRPIVRTILHPPMAVPSVSVAPEATLTQSGTESVSSRPPATRSAAVTPIAF